MTLVETVSSRSPDAPAATAKTESVAASDGRLLHSGERFEPLTHYLLRYPAKFHPPVAKHLVESFTAGGDWVLDPFCGSGTLLVEARAIGRNAAGTDIDPLAVLASRVKSRRYRPAELKAASDRLLLKLKSARRTASEYDSLVHVDISQHGFRASVGRRHLSIPEIPNIEHWFRRYVVVDLAEIRRAISDTAMSSCHADFLKLIFASIIRRASNADPVPVSGLEVTKHMRDLDAKGRRIDPFELLEDALAKALIAFKAYWETGASTESVAVAMDARRLTLRRKFDAVITSPPYHGAVDYYRRHTLETYWLGFARDLDERLLLLPKYIGRAKVPQGHEYSTLLSEPGSYLETLSMEILATDKARAHALQHYAFSMKHALSSIARVVKKDAPVVIVVGNSRWSGGEIDTPRLFRELSGRLLSSVAHYWYPIKNRYMSYTRHNGADINQEHVLVFRRRGGEHG